MILVTGATGRVGYHLMELLADANAEATAMVRVEARAADLPGTPRHTVASFDDPPPAEILREFDRVFLLSPAHEEQASMETVFIDAIAAAGHRPHVVKIAADGFQDPDCEVRFMRSHREVAAHLDALGLPVTYLAPSLYMENLLAAADTLRKEGTIRAPAGRGRVGFVAARDVAAVAARVLTSPGHDDAIYVLTGPEALRYADVARRFSAVFAREAGYESQRRPGTAAHAGRRDGQLGGRRLGGAVRVGQGRRRRDGDPDRPRGDRRGSAPDRGLAQRRAGGFHRTGARPAAPRLLTRAGRHGRV